MSLPLAGAEIYGAEVDILRELDSRKAQIEALCKELETYRKELAHYKDENEQLLNCVRQLAAIIGGMSK